MSRAVESWEFTADGQIVAEGMDVAVLEAVDRFGRLVVFDCVVPEIV